MWSVPGGLKMMKANCCPLGDQRASITRFLFSLADATSKPSKNGAKVYVPSVVLPGGTI